MLVAGATGGVGVVALQLLKTRGARVIATASTDEEIAFVRDHGAHHVVRNSPDALAAGTIRAR